MTAPTDEAGYMPSGTIGLMPRLFLNQLPLMFKHALLPFFILLLHTPALIAQPELIKAKAEECQMAFLHGDYGRMADLTYPRVVARIGGREAFIKAIRKNMDEIAADGFTLDTMIVRLPTRIVTTKRRIYGVVPYDLIMQTPEGRLLQESIMLGISEDKGTSWTFIDINSESAKMLQGVFPDEKGLSKRLALPARKQPRLIEE